MGKIGHGYGSEWHLLRYLGRHRAALTRRILEEVGGESLQWPDAPFASKAPFDAEWKGVDFLPEGHPGRAVWVKTWPQTGNVPNWDAVGLLTRNSAPEWLLIEAKAHLHETRSSCTAKPHGGLEDIKSALGVVKQALGAAGACDWLNGYYQFCNRVALLHFLQTQEISARLLFIYFTGDEGDTRRCCPQDSAGWSAELRRLEEHVGLPPGHALADRIHKLFVPVTLGGPAFAV